MDPGAWSACDTAHSSSVASVLCWCLRLLFLFLSTVADHIGHASHIHCPLGFLPPAPAADLHVLTKPTLLVPLSVCKCLIPNSKKSHFTGVVTERNGIMLRFSISPLQLVSSHAKCPREQVLSPQDSLPFPFLPHYLDLHPTSLFPPLFSLSLPSLIS